MRWRSGCFSLIGIPLGDRRFDALYLAVAVALRSTVIIVKVLYDKRELDTLPGRVTLGVLVLQDLFAILFLAIQPSLNDLHFDVVLVSVLRVGALLATALLISRYTLPHLFRLIARLPELVLVGALAWCFAVAEFAEFLRPVARDGRADRRRFALDLPLCARRHRQGDVAARFLHHAVFRRARHDDPAADGLGARSRARSRRVHAGRAGSLTVFPPLYLMRQGLRASLLPAINLAQISEFSLVLIQVGVQSGQTTPGDRQRGIRRLRRARGAEHAS